MSKFLFFVVAALLVALAPAQFAMPRAKAMVAFLPEVQKELKLTKEQRKAINDAVEDMRKNPPMMDPSAMMMGAGGGNMDAMDDQMDKRTLANLDDNQLARLTELWYQYNGPSLVTKKAVADALSLTADQRSQIQAISKKHDDDKMNYLMHMSGSDRHAKDNLEKLDKAEDDAILALFTADQAQQWKTMQGAPFKFKTRRAF